MSGSDEAAGVESAVDARAQGVQPVVPNGFDLGAPVPLVNVLLNLSAEHAKESRRLQESLERRAADKELLDELAASDFAGRLYRRFEGELARYGMSVLPGLMHSGYIFKLVAERGFPLHPTDAELEEMARDSDARQELANMTVAIALPRFRERALIRGGWRFEGGASLSTYFVGACLYVFPNEFRGRRVYQKKWQRAQFGDAVTVVPDANPITNPAVIATGNIRVRDDLEQLDERTKAIVALTVDGYSQEEIVELLDETSIRAVEGVLHRWRKQQQPRVNEGGERDE